MPDAVLTLNAGSSSIKFALFAAAGEMLSPISTGQVEGIGAKPHFVAHAADGAVLVEKNWPEDAARAHEDLLQTLLDWVETHLGDDRLIAIGHRVVHGGPEYRTPILVTPAVIDALDRLTPLAPLHQPHNLAPIRAIADWRENLPQVACFDTAFHHTMAPVATRLALPRRFQAEGVRRYGFHGLSYEFIAGHLRETHPDLANQKIIVAHLGNGASLCALREGRSIDTTMGFSALDGLVMGTRCGTLDPGVILYLMQTHGLGAADIQKMLYQDSGLLGVSGIGSDMRALLASRDRAASDAIDLFVFRFAREAGALASTLGGLDALVFTAGIGEHAPEIRAAICEKLAWLGIALNPTANDAGAKTISIPGSRVTVLAVHTDEELMIARHTLATIRAATA